MSATPAPPPRQGPVATRAPELIPFAEPVGQTAARKDDHLRIAATTRALHAGGNGLDRHRLIHRAMPGRDLDQVDLATSLLGRPLDAPVVISAMTGGTPAAGVINARLAEAAARHGVALALGSGRALLRDPRLLSTYVGPARPPLLIANIGAPQLLEADGLDEAERLVDLLDADAIAVQLNPLQEAIQPEGQTSFSGLVERIAALCGRLEGMPVVVKEVGFGIH
ncbi:MAG: alpha-hydroxy-acid oxidizing protein, partial [Solirubrobacteraceae bacterium]|nr:alpha-hydroxy-acid oxidizing protein [Solirubrobacteraceae bacterium]